MTPVSNLNLLLTDGYSTQYDCSSQGLQNVTISTQNVGELFLTSGWIIACDPLMGPDSRYYFTKTVEPGSYPVILSLARFNASGDSRFSCAMLKMSEAPTARWELAAINGPGRSGSDSLTSSYGVDAGTGCFVDRDVAKMMESLVSLEVRYPEKDNFELFCESAVAEMERNSFGPYPLTAGWADLRVGADAEANIICFSSGWGDGSYSSFWGYDASGNVTGLVTDFALLPRTT
jgi:hypothetical protein